jgi:hypothetical protein
MGGRALHVPDLLSDPSRPGAISAHVDVPEPELPEPPEASLAPGSGQQLDVAGEHPDSEGETSRVTGHGSW